MKIEKIKSNFESIVLASIIIYSIFSLYQLLEHVEYNRSYIGRKFIYYSDTITIIDAGRAIFTTNKNVDIHENIVYKLKEVKK